MSSSKSTQQFDEGRLMQVIVAPVVSEKATMVAFSDTMGAIRTCIRRPSSNVDGLMRTSPSVCPWPPW